MYVFMFSQKAYISEHWETVKTVVGVEFPSNNTCACFPFSYLSVTVSTSPQQSHVRDAVLCQSHYILPLLVICT